MWQTGGRLDRLLVIHVKFTVDTRPEIKLSLSRRKPLLLTPGKCTSDMVLELHIWGSAFELPSIDAQCLAAIFYLRCCLPHDEWKLVPSSDPRVSPLGELPALRDGDSWIAGYGKIVDYLQDISNGRWSLNENLKSQQHADNAAFTAFIKSRGQPLLDLCQYVSSDNYHNCTRPALAKILTWPNSWTIPQELRDQAKRRSEHLGLSSLDVDAAQEDEDRKEKTGLTAQIPKSLRKPKQTITSFLGRSQQKNRFRLDAVTEDFLEPMSDMLGDKQWLLGDHASSVDCLAIGYLALMQTMQLQHGWLGETLRTKHSRLDDWARRHTTEAFGTSVDGNAALPWQVPDPRSSIKVYHEILEGCIGALPVVGARYAVSEISYTTKQGVEGVRQKQTQLMRLQQRRDLYLDILTSSVASIGLIAWLMHEGMLRLPRWSRPAPSQRRFGEAGALLGLG